MSHSAVPPQGKPTSRRSLTTFDDDEEEESTASTEATADTTRSSAVARRQRLNRSWAGSETSAPGSPLGRGASDADRAPWIDDAGVAKCFQCRAEARGYGGMYVRACSRCVQLIAHAAGGAGSVGLVSEGGEPLASAPIPADILGMLVEAGSFEWTTASLLKAACREQRREMLDSQRRARGALLARRAGSGSEPPPNHRPDDIAASPPDLDELVSVDACPLAAVVRQRLRAKRGGSERDADFFKDYTRRAISIGGDLFDSALLGGGEVTCSDPVIIDAVHTAFSAAGFSEGDVDAIVEAYQQTLLYTVRYIVEAFARDVMALPLVRAPTFVLDLAKDTSTGGLVVATLSLDGVCVFDAEAPDLYEGVGFEIPPSIVVKFVLVGGRFFLANALALTERAMHAMHRLAVGDLEAPVSGTPDESSANTSSDGFESAVDDPLFVAEPSGGGAGGGSATTLAWAGDSSTRTN